MDSEITTSSSVTSGRITRQSQDDIVIEDINERGTTEINGHHQEDEIDDSLKKISDER